MGEQDSPGIGAGGDNSNQQPAATTPFSMSDLGALPRPPRPAGSFPAFGDEMPKAGKSLSIRLGKICCFRAARSVVYPVYAKEPTKPMKLWPRKGKRNDAVPLLESMESEDSFDYQEYKP